MALTDKHMKFVDEYMVDMNATAAYRRAGYTAEGNSAEVNASRLLRNAKVSEEIAKRQKKMQEKTGMSVEWVLDKYKTLVDDNLSVDPAVAKSALDSVAKHFGMFTDKVKMDMSGGLNNTAQDLTGLTPGERRARIDELNRRRGTGALTTS